MVIHALPSAAGSSHAACTRPSAMDTTMMTMNALAIGRLRTTPLRVGTGLVKTPTSVPRNFSSACSRLGAVMST